jgi:hypothetical protein
MAVENNKRGSLTSKEILESLYGTFFIPFPEDIPQELGVNLPPLTLAETGSNNNLEDAYVWLCERDRLVLFPRDFQINQDQISILHKAVTSGDIKIVPYMLKKGNFDGRDCKVFEDDSGMDEDFSTFPGISVKVNFQLTTKDHKKQLAWPTHLGLRMCLEDELISTIKGPMQEVLNKVITSAVPEWQPQTFYAHSGSTVFGETETQERDLAGTIAGVEYSRSLPGEQRKGIFSTVEIALN